MRLLDREDCHDVKNDLLNLALRHGFCVREFPFPNTKPRNNWSRFEVDPEKEFQNIPAQHTTQSSIPYDLQHGTILEITILRSDDWNRAKLLELRRSLERLVNPNQENDADNFQIHLHCLTERPEDDRLKAEAKKRGERIEAWQLVNGAVRNFVFETLDLKTAQIMVEIDSDGKTITTRFSRNFK